LPLLSNIAEILKDSILPPLCAVCGGLCETYICKSCLSKVKPLGGNICLRCGSALTEYLPGKDSQKLKCCSLCKNEDYSFYMARSFAYYNSAVAEIIRKFKYKKFYYLKGILLSFLKKAYEYYYMGLKFDFIETVPAYIGRAKENIKSHMQMLMPQLSICLKIPYGDNIIKVRQTLKQQELGRQSRKMNLENSFKVRNSLKVARKNILLVDDVFTTGSTLNQISRQLKNAGAQVIYILTVARGA
jgi:competence protein ComFC